MSLIHRCDTSIAVEPEGDAGAAPGRLSLDVSAGARHSTLLDEYERLAIEAQLSRAVLHRSYSEPSPARIVVQVEAPAVHGHATVHRDEKEGRRSETAGRFWWIGEAARRWLEALKPIFCWLGRAWDGRKEPAVPPPSTAPRMQLLDYLRNR